MQSGSTHGASEGLPRVVIRFARLLISRTPAELTETHGAGSAFMAHTLLQKRHAAAQPLPHKYELSPLS